MNTTPNKIAPALQPYLKPLFPRAQRVRLPKPKPPTSADLVKFKRELGSRVRDKFKRERRQSIQTAFGKPVEALTLREYRDYCHEGFWHKIILKELWPQLTPAEQRIVRRLNEWAFVFPASFETERDFLRACARRLQKFFGRKFTVNSPAQRQSSIFKN
jgi:hypothetical protein